MQEYVKKCPTCHSVLSEGRFGVKSGMSYDLGSCNLCKAGSARVLELSGDHLKIRVCMLCLRELSKIYKDLF